MATEVAVAARRSAGPNEGFIGVRASRARLNTPALLLDVDALDRNIAAMAAHAKAAGINLRPHSKGGKSVTIARRQLAAGATGICCATLGEAEVMVDAGVPGVLITSPVVTPPMIARLTALNAKARGLMVVADDPSTVAAQAAAAAGTGKPLSLIVEFDIGQRRTGILQEDGIIALARLIADSPHLRFAGVQAYYGHLQHINSPAERRSAAEVQLGRLRALTTRLAEENLAPPVVTGGGTGTFETDAASGVFTEIQPGSYPFMDREYREIDWNSGREQPFQPALFVVASVISSNRDGFAVVNAGYKSFATEGVMPLLVSPRLKDAAYKFLGDEHGGLTFDPSGGSPRIGDPVEFLVPHCDPTINLYDRYHCVSGDTLVDIWPVDTRGR